MFAPGTLFAPGTYIKSACHTNDDGFTFKEGTSMATPHVSGAAVLLLASGIKPSEIKKTLLKDATEGKLKNIGNGSPNKLLYVGTGDEEDPTASQSASPTMFLLFPTAAPSPSPSVIEECPKETCSIVTPTPSPRPTIHPSGAPSSAPTKNDSFSYPKPNDQSNSSPND
mmetsp:Transcript_13983/g.21329  ORF Transcript_13983/g.21329 Transcript_13983/m.21329 type:complete len:169 (+) Transcript_13983:1365-1871(+)